MGRFYRRVQLSNCKHTAGGSLEVRVYLQHVLRSDSLPFADFLNNYSVPIAATPIILNITVSFLHPTNT